jgi:hypothetical protein
MTTIDALVRGIAEQVCNGDVLLGFSARHIYPDMNVLGALLKEIKMKDLLVT